MTHLCILSLIHFTAHAATLPPPFPPLGTSGKKDGKNLFITLTPPTPSHFNLKAPFSLQRASQKIKPLHINPDSIQYQIPSPQTEDFLVTLYLCDDAKTRCEKQSTLIHWDSEKELLLIQNR